MENRIFVLIGTTGAGKTFYSKKMIEELGFQRIYAVTTRAPRPTHPDEYIHVSKPEFEKMISNGEMLEYTTFNGNYYGRRRKDIAEKLSLGHAAIDMTTDRIAELKKEIPNAVVVHVSLPEPVLANTAKRVSDRNWSDLELEERLELVEKDLREIDNAYVQDLIDHKLTTIEDEPEKTFDLLKEIVNKYL